MEQELCTALYFPARAKPALAELTRTELIAVAESEGVNPAGATNGELRDSISQKRNEVSQGFNTDRVRWESATVKVQTANQSVSLQ